MSGSTQRPKSVPLRSEDHDLSPQSSQSLLNKESLPQDLLQRAEILDFAHSLLVPITPLVRDELARGQYRSGVWITPNQKQLETTLSSTVEVRFDEPAVVETISVEQFVGAYCDVHTKVLGRAHALIDEFGDKLALLQYRESNTVAKTSFSSPSLTQQEANEIIRGTIVAASLNHEHPAHERFAVNMAILVMDQAEHRADLLLRCRENADFLKKHTAIMSDALAAAEGQENQVGFLAALTSAFKAKHAQYGSFPRLILLNDMDKNLTPVESYNAIKPSHEIDLLFGEIIDHHIKGIPGYQRCPIAHDLSAYPEFRSKAAELYLGAGRGVAPHLHRDAITALHRAVELGVGFEILTGNLADVAVGAAAALGDVNIPVRGTHYDNMRASDKPLQILATLLENSNAVIVMVDDSDSSLIRGLKSDSISGSPIALNHACFFVARGPDARDGLEHKLALELKAKKIPHGLNTFIVNDENNFGYQGVHAVLDLYEELSNSAK